MLIDAVREDRMRGGRIQGTKSILSASPGQEGTCEISVDGGAKKGEFLQKISCKHSSPINPTAATIPFPNQDTPPSQNVYWNPQTSSTICGVDSINSHTGPQTESWSSSKSASIASTAGPVNGPLRLYMSAAVTPSSSHHTLYTSCSTSSSIPGPYDGCASKKKVLSPPDNAIYLPSSADEPSADVTRGSSEPDSKSVTPNLSDELRYCPRNTPASCMNQQTALMWSGRTPPISRSTDYYRPAPLQPQPLKGSGSFDQVESGGFHSMDNHMEQENLEHTLEEIAELEGELSSDDEASIMEVGELGFSNGIRTAASVAPVGVPFEGINFAQLFSASNDHSEKLISLTKQFYPKLKEYLIQASTHGEMILNSTEGGFVTPDDGRPDGISLAASSPDSLLHNIFCKLSSMLEECLFYMVDWVNRTEIFSVIRVEDKMQLLYSSWSEVIVIEFLQCVILNLQVEDRPDVLKVDAGSPREPANRDLYYLVKELMDYLLPLDDDNQRIRDLIARFSTLNLSSHEFTCLKFLVIFNPYKHDVSLTSSLHYVRDVQADLCYFLLRAARRAIKQMPPPPPPPFSTFSPHPSSSSTLTTIAAAERLSQLLLHLTEVKHVAFQLESFLVARYYANCIPNESLLTEMLLTKRVSCVGGGRSSVPPPPPPPPPSSAPTSYRFSGDFPLPHLKRDPNGYTPLPPPKPLWRLGDGGRGTLTSASYSGIAAVAAHSQHFPPTPHSVVSSGYQPPQSQPQDQSFFMPPPQQQQPYTSASVI